MHYVGANLGENWVKIGYTLIGFSPPQQKDLSCQVPDVCAKFNQNLLEIVTVRVCTQPDIETHKVKTLSPSFTTFTWRR